MNVYPSERDRHMVNKMFLCNDVYNNGVQLVDMMGRDRHGAGLGCFGEGVIMVVLSVGGKPALRPKDGEEALATEAHF